MVGELNSYQSLRKLRSRSKSYIFGKAYFIITKKFFSDSSHRIESERDQDL
jgi:hypothetical protein